MESPTVRFNPVSDQDGTNSLSWDTSTRWYANAHGGTGTDLVDPKECTSLDSFDRYGSDAGDLAPSADFNFVQSATAMSNSNGEGQLRIYVIDTPAHAQTLADALAQQATSCSSFKRANAKGENGSDVTLQVKPVTDAPGVQLLAFTIKSGYRDSGSWPVFLMHKGNLLLSLNPHDSHRVDAAQLSTIAAQLSTALDALPQ